MVPVCVTELCIAINKLQKNNISCFQILQTSHMSEACLPAISTPTCYSKSCTVSLQLNFERNLKEPTNTTKYSDTLSWPL